MSDLVVLGPWEQALCMWMLDVLRPRKRLVMVMCNRSCILEQMMGELRVTR